MSHKIYLLIIGIFLLVPMVNSCKISYSFTGTNLAADIKSFSVAYFPNRAKLINPNLSQKFTEEFREKLTRQTSLNEEEEMGDLEYSGYITGYDIRPMAIQKNDLAAQNRLTITINVKYVNNKDHEQDFEKSFTGYQDYESIVSFDAVEEELIDDIIKKITEDLFNATIANW